MARVISAAGASAAPPRTSSLAGLMLVKVPACPSTSLPSIIIFDSKRNAGVSAIFFALLSVLVWGPHSCGRRTRQSTESWDSHHQARHGVQPGRREQPV